MTNLTHTVTLGDPRFFAPADRATVRITREQRDAINAANAAERSVPTDITAEALFAEMFGTDA